MCCDSRPRNFVRAFARPRAHHDVAMKAVVLTGYGDVDKLELRELPDPSPGPGEIAVRVAAASINPADWKVRSGALTKLMPLELPAAPGKGVAGGGVHV